MKKKYVKPEVEVVSIETENLLAASGAWGSETDNYMEFSDEEYDGEFD